MRFAASRFWKCGDDGLLALVVVGGVVLQPENPVGGVFAAGGSAHLAVATGVVDDDDGDFAAAKCEQPREQGFPSGTLRAD